MIIANEKQFAKLSADGSRALENSFIYLLSRDLKKIEKDDDEILAGNDYLTSLCPTVELLAKFKAEQISKKKFKKEYHKHLKSDENRFLLYTIIRSIREKKYVPIFVCSDDEWEIGYLQILADYIQDTFGVKQVKVKKYLEIVEKIWKQTKKSASKKSKREKAFRTSMKEEIKDNIQLSFEGLKKLGDLDKKFAIDRMALLLNQSEDSDEIGKKKIVESIELYGKSGNKAAKRVKAAVKKLNISKKSHKWSRNDAIKIVLEVYSDVHSAKDEE